MVTKYCPRSQICRTLRNRTSLNHPLERSAINGARDMLKQGGRHEQHVKAGQQSHKNRQQDQPLRR
ncbi:hypothetical protein EJ071_14650 [Mesorhizobium sp. M1B.F.Ca.ET.045.04.1.1]|nr:hypothetical protein EJ071_14650 [Mesorhizobium sp. M1B.F.Ca.ET.045.04.1.1]